MSLDKLSEIFNPEAHPDVLAGLRKPDDVYNEFMETFEGNHNYLNGDEAPLGNVDIDEFCDYYDSISMMIKKDKDFKKIVSSVWGLVLEQGAEEKSQSQFEENKEIKDEQKLKGKKIIKQIEKEESEDNLNENLKENINEKEINEAFSTFRNYLQAQGPMTVLSIIFKLKVL